MEVSKIRCWQTSDAGFDIFLCLLGKYKSVYPQYKSDTGKPLTTGIINQGAPVSRYLRLSRCSIINHFLCLLSHSSLFGHFFIELFMEKVSLRADVILTQVNT